MTKKWCDFLALTRNITSCLQVSTEDATKGQKKLAKILEILKPYNEDYNSKRDEILVDFALEENGRIVLNEKGDYVYDKDGIKGRDKALLSLYNSEFEYKVIELTRPDNLEPYTFLNGWVNLEFLTDEITL